MIGRISDDVRTFSRVWTIMIESDESKGARAGDPGACSGDALHRTRLADVISMALENEHRSAGQREHHLGTSLLISQSMISGLAWQLRYEHIGLTIRVMTSSVYDAMTDV